MDSPLVVRRTVPESSPTFPRKRWPADTSEPSGYSVNGEGIDPWTGALITVATNVGYG